MVKVYGKDGSGNQLEGLGQMGHRWTLSLVLLHETSKAPSSPEKTREGWRIPTSCARRKSACRSYNFPRSIYEAVQTVLDCFCKHRARLGCRWNFERPDSRVRR